MPEKTTIAYPYLPEGCEIRYVPAGNAFMHAARQVAQKDSLDTKMPVGSVIVKDNKIIGRGANGSQYHVDKGCERKKLGSPTGQDYDKCAGCQPQEHSEAKAIADALTRVDPEALKDSQLYLWGHWWCCQPCWEAMQKVGIHTAYLLNKSEVLFNKDNPGNVVGRQFEVA